MSGMDLSLGERYGRPCFACCLRAKHKTHTVVQTTMHEHNHAKLQLRDAQDMWETDKWILQEDDNGVTSLKANKAVFLVILQQNQMRFG